LWTDVRTLLRKLAVFRVEPVIFADRFSWWYLSQLRIVLQHCTVHSVLPSAVLPSSVSRRLIHVVRLLLVRFLLVIRLRLSSTRHPSVHHRRSSSTSPAEVRTTTLRDVITCRTCELCNALSHAGQKTTSSPSYLGSVSIKFPIDIFHN